MKLTKLFVDSSYEHAHLIKFDISELPNQHPANYIEHSIVINILVISEV